ncbi:tetratricopeptide repeat protein [Wenzhouxiangella sp. EGI_FJ10305]|uniref:tetratricopeptide repeat protein n=1 Tax=Wenzhouxiangella sp. EGI_FJ10305 TaxID=3243768 RepID=UPI0035D85CCA
MIEMTTSGARFLALAGASAMALGLAAWSDHVLAQGDSSELVELPQLQLDDVAEPVREALVEARERVERASGSDSNEVALAEAYGHFADVSLAHELTAQARAAYRNAIALRPDRQEWHYLLGLLEIGEGDLAAGIASLNRAIELYPRDHAALIHRARAHLEAGDFDRAERDFLAAQELVPDSPAVLGGLGRVALEQGEPEAAVDHLEQALEQAPEAAAVHQALGMAHRELGNADRARQHLEQGGEARAPMDDPTLDRIRRLSRSPQFFLEAGLSQADRGNFEAAAGLLERARELDPESDNILRQLGEVQARLGRLDAARESFAELVARSSVNAEAYLLLGQVEELRGEFDAALTAYRDALAIDENYREAEEAIAFARFNQREFELAAEQFRKLAESAPDPAGEARHVYWQGMIALAQGRCDEAAERINRARSLTEDENADVLTALARMRATCLDAGDEALDEALEWAVALYDAQPDMETAATRAMVHAARGEFDDAVDFQAQALFEALKRYGEVEARPDLQAEMERYRDERPAERPFGPENPVFSPGMG